MIKNYTFSKKGIRKENLDYKVAIIDYSGYLTLKLDIKLKDLTFTVPEGKKFLISKINFNYNEYINNEYKQRYSTDGYINFFLPNSGQISMYFYNQIVGDNGRVYHIERSLNNLESKYRNQNILLEAGTYKITSNNYSNYYNDNSSSGYKIYKSNYDSNNTAESKKQEIEGFINNLNFNDKSSSFLGNMCFLFEILGEELIDNE